MTLRQKTLLIISITLVGLITLLYFISQTILLNSFTQLEEQDVRQNVQRVTAALQDKLATLDSIAGDWAPWDDTYKFVMDGNETYIESNLQESTLLNFNINAMLFLNTAGELVFGKAIDLQTQTAVDTPPSLQDHLANNTLILSHTTPQEGLSGLISLPEGPLLFASHPIVTSNYEGPIHGTLLVGRYLDAAEIESLAEQTHLSISVRRFDEAQLPPDFQAARTTLAPDSPILVRPLDQQNVAGYTIIEDVYGQPALLLKVALPRNIYGQGQASLSYFMVSFLVSGLVFGWVILLLLEKEVLSRLSQLNWSVKAIAEAGNSAGRVKVFGNDELASLSENINKMLTALGQSEEALRQTHQELEIRVEERTAELSQSNTLLKREIQERQQAEHALRQSEQRFRHFVSSISDHIYVTEITEPGQRLNIYLSPHVEPLTGYPLDKFIADWSFWPSTVIHPDDRAAAAAQAARLAQGQNSEVEYRLIRANGDIIWVRDSGRVERDAVRQSLMIYGLVSDITERKQAEAALALAHNQALEASRLKTELLAKVSHELRTPLGAILGFAEMLEVDLYGPLSDKKRQMTAKIIDSTQYLTNLVNELLDQAQLEAGRLRLNIRPFAPADLVNNTLARMNVLAQAKGLSLATDIDPDMPAMLQGDAARLQQILVNLISNAIKFTPAGGVRVRLYCPNADHWALQVSDTGSGIPKEAQGYIFEPFRQVDGSMTRVQAGTGLGLSIVKQLTILMRGEITLESEIGQGSTFTISFPLEPIQEQIA
ncbi:MAG: ATP-binding protein [Anaerolineae bacterium]|nr:ATP-binding protein [Anaerolineae bacterium]